MAELAPRAAASGLVVREPRQDLPLICSRCLGDEDNVRMVRDSRGSECVLCSRPFPTYRWRRPGGSRTFEQTIICTSCAEAKGACQSCMADREHDMPLRFRELVQRLVAEEGGQDTDIGPALAAVAAEWHNRTTQVRINESESQAAEDRQIEDPREGDDVLQQGIKQVVQ